MKTCAPVKDTRPGECKHMRCKDRGVGRHRELSHNWGSRVPEMCMRRAELGTEDQDMVKGEREYLK